MNGVNFSTEGRRCYITGNTFLLKDAIKDVGGHWDAARKAWWVGSAKQAEIEAAMQKAVPVADKKRNDILSSNDEIAGKATYKGRTYLLLWSGETKRGKAARLAFMDGSKIFWADLSQVLIVKTYPDMTFGKLERLRKEYKEGGNQGKECWLCAKIERQGGAEALRRHLFDGCDVCGNEYDG